jgi:hypothetical protein
MFISKAEKENLHHMIAQLQYQVRSLTDRCEEISSSYKNLTLRFNEISVHKGAEKNDIEHIKHERKKASMREYYHRKKAERLEKESKEKTAFQLATLALKTETSQ